MSASGARVGQSVTLVGRGFGKDTNSISVLFGSAKATITRCADSLMVVRVPDMRGVCLVSAARLGSTDVFKDSFTVWKGGIASVSTTDGYPGDTVRAALYDYGPYQGTMRVWLSGFEAIIVSATRTHVDFVLPNIVGYTVNVTIEYVDDSARFTSTSTVLVLGLRNPLPTFSRVDITIDSVDVIYHYHSDGNFSGHYGPYIFADSTHTGRFGFEAHFNPKVVSSDSAELDESQDINTAVGAVAFVNIQWGNVSGKLKSLIVSVLKSSSSYKDGPDYCLGCPSGGRSDGVRLSLSNAVITDSSADVLKIVMPLTSLTDAKSWLSAGPQQSETNPSMGVSVVRYDQVASFVNPPPSATLRITLTK